MTEGHAGEPTAVCALEEVLLSAEGCVRLAAQRLGGADPLSDVLEDLLRALEPIGTEVRGTQDAPAEGGIRTGDPRSGSSPARAYAAAGAARE